MAKPKPKECSSCGVVNKHNAKFCSNCGLQLEPHLESDEKSRWYEIFKDFFLHIFPFINIGILKILQNMLLRPGRSLRDAAKELEKEKKAIPYFLLFLAFYLCLNHYFFEPQGFENQLLSKFSDLEAPFLLTFLMLAIWLIGYTTLGWNGKHFKTKYDYYTPFEVFIICLYIYGTNFFLAPIIIIVSIYFDDILRNYLENNFHLSAQEVVEYKGQLTDIPLALFMFYMLFSLMRNTPNYKYLLWRYLAFCILSLSYYKLMYGVVLNWSGDKG